MCRTFTTHPDYDPAEEFGFPLTVCACNDPDSDDYNLTFGSTGSIEVGPIPGGTLPSVEDMNGWAQDWAAANFNPPFSPEFFTGAEADVDNGPC